MSVLFECFQRIKDYMRERTGTYRRLPHCRETKEFFHSISYLSVFKFSLDSCLWRNPQNLSTGYSFPCFQSLKLINTALKAFVIWKASWFLWYLFYLRFIKVCNICYFRYSHRRWRQKVSGYLDFYLSSAVNTLNEELIISFFFEKNMGICCE